MQVQATLLQLELLLEQMLVLPKLKQIEQLLLRLVLEQLGELSEFKKKEEEKWADLALDNFERDGERRAN